ncbi:hypothetical protein M885DRAFT_517493, partial [Pelagophyceae sp. CCMP2097]
MGRSSSALERQIASPARRPNVALECARPDVFFLAAHDPTSLSLHARGLTSRSSPAEFIAP